MPETLPSGCSYSRRLSTPWFILRKETLASNGDALIFAVLWSALSHCTTSERADGTSPKRVNITNAEIGRQSGIKSEWAVRYHLRKLEKLGYIKRCGNHKNRLIEILVSAADNRVLVIDNETINSDLSPTQKLLEAITSAFPSAGRNWICERLGISEWTYFTKHQPGEKTKFNPVRKPSQPGEKTKCIKGNNILDLTNLDRLAKANLAPAVPMEEEMPFDYNQAGYLNNSIKHRPPKKQTPIPEDIIIELTEEIFQHKHITTHRTNNQLDKAAKVVRALRRPGGLSTILDQAQIQQIITCLSNGFNKLDPELIRTTLHKQFDEEERVELYLRISNDMSKAYGGSGKKISLVEAVWSTGAPGFSRLVKVWLKPPQLKETSPPVPTVTQELKKLVVVLEKYIDNFSLSPYAITQISQLQQYHKQEVKLGLFDEWFMGLVKFAYNKARQKNQQFHLGWVAVGALTFMEWQTIFNKEQRQIVFESARAKALSEASANRGEIERDEAFKEAYGIRV